MIAKSGREAGPNPVRQMLAAAVGNGRPQASLRAKSISRSPSIPRAAAGATGSQSREVRLNEGAPQIPTFKELRAANARGPQETKSAYKALIKSGAPLRDQGALVDKGCQDAIEWAIIAGLNFEAEGRAAGEPRAWPQIASQAQQVALANISCAAAYFAKDALEPLSDLDIDKLIKLKGIGYSGQEAERGGPLVMGELLPGLPKPGLAGSVQAMDLAAPHVQEWLLDPALLLKPQDGWPEEVPKASVQVASDDEWYALCKHLVDAGIVEPVEDRGVFQVGGKQVLAGAFAVAKSGAPAPPFTRVTRLIINMVPQNAYQRIAETDLDTLTPSSTWASIVVPDGQALLWSSDDQSGAYHLYALPKAWRGYMALRKPVPGSLVGRPQLKWVKMAVAVIPMGWLSAVSLFQHLHRRLGIGDGPHSAGFEEKVEWRRDRPLPLVPQAKAQAWVQYYLDDFDSPEIVPESVATLIEGTISDFQERQRRAYSSARVPWSDKKAVCRQRRLFRMGAFVDGGAGRVGVTIDNLMSDGQMIMWLLAGKEKVTAKACLMVLGRLARAFEFRRPLFATLNEQGGSALQQVVRLPEGARTELLAALCLLPMAFTSIRATFDPVVLATDASEEGGGLCYSTGLTKHGAEVAGADPGEEGLAFLPRGAMSSAVPPELLPRGVPLPTVALFDFFGGIGGAMVALSRCRCRVVMYASSEIDKGAKRCVRQRWPGVIELGDITKLAPESLGKVARSAAEAASYAIAGGGSPCIDVSGLNAAGKGITGAKSKLFFELPEAFRTIERVFGKQRTKWFVENVASMPQDDIAMVSEVLGVKPYRIEAMDVAVVRRPRLYWLSWQLQARDDVIEIQEAEFYHKVKLHVAAEAVPVFAEDGWGLLDPSHALPTFAKLCKRNSPPAPDAGIKTASDIAIERWTASSYVTQVYNFEDQNLLWDAAMDKWRIPTADERETLMGFDRGYTRAAVKDSLPGVEAEIIRSSLIGNSFSVQVVSYLFAQLLAREAGRAAPDIAPLLRTGAAPPSWGQEPEFWGAEVSDPDLERRLVFKYLRIASRGGADVRLDLQAPFRAKAWPRSGLQSNLWTWPIGHGFPWRQEAHINELEVGAAVKNAVKWRARTTARFGTRYLHLFDSQVAASVLAKGRSSARGLWGWMRARASCLLACGSYPLYACVDTDDNPADAAAARLKRAVDAKRLRRSRPLQDGRVAAIFVNEQQLRPKSVRNVDQGVALYTEHVWRTGGSLLAVNNALAAVLFVSPSLSGKLKQSWKLQKTWLKLEPNARAMPMPPLLALAFAGAFCWWGLPRAGALLAVGYAGMLRSGEMLQLRRKDIRISQRRMSAIVALRNTKTGQRDGRLELVMIRSRVAVKLLVQHVQQLPPDELILNIERGEFMRLFRRVVVALGLTDERVTLYSFRRGGAAHDFLEHGSLELTLLRGRWASARSARVYVQDAVAALAELQLSDLQLADARALASHV
ncbi:unnamed protein product [Prorocentrum cordatum]|uniref:DNA (cytosine-5-)-methyltransferase n=1 Tax=Prorocentrum cordatum TaxID=2364126 RepID=A0ABN9X8P7_9DINO|nr:unnamed protein product [Polarella glacialis]